MQILDWSELDEAARAAALRRPAPIERADMVGQVSAIIDDVRARGDERMVEREHEMPPPRSGDLRRESIHGGVGRGVGAVRGVTFRAGPRVLEPERVQQEEAQVGAQFDGHGPAAAAGATRGPACVVASVSTSSGNASATGPGRPLSAMRNARAKAAPRSSACSICSTCLTSCGRKLV